MANELTLRISKGKQKGGMSERWKSGEKLSVDDLVTT